MKKIEGRVGLCFITKYGESFIIIEYVNNTKVKIKFKNGCEKWVAWNNIIKNTVISPYAKTVYNMGYIGVGKFNHKNSKKEYEYWKYIIRRCYDPYFINEHITYKDCFIEEYLLNFQNFIEWFKINYFEIEKETMEIDKDILKKGNKIYDREHMIFVPKRINSLFVKCDKSRGEYPIGVSWHKSTNKFIARCNILDENNKNKRIHLGIYNTQEEAFKVYKNFKENYIKQVADEYYSKGLIPKKLYDAMYKYEVEIND